MTLPPNMNSNNQNQPRNFDIVFKMLEKAKKEQQEKTKFSESDYKEIDESIKMLEEIQQSVDTASYTIFTRA